MKPESVNGRKALQILLSILVAVGIWVFVDTAQGYTVDIELTDVPIEFIGEDTTLADRGLMLLDSSQRTTGLKITGTRALLMKLDPDAIRVTANLNGVTTTGTQRLDLTLNWPNQEFNRLGHEFDSNSITVEIGELYSASVEIRCDIQGTVSEGYMAGEVQLQPSVLELRGQQEKVDQVSYAKVTLSIDDATETMTQSLPYVLCDENGNEIADTSDIHPVADTIEVVLPVNVVKELELQVNFLESPGFSMDNVDYEIEPKSIMVSGDAVLLRDVSVIKLDDFDLSALRTSAVYYYQISLPAGCDNLSGVTQAMLTISFKDMAAATVEATQFECLNQPEGKLVTVLTTELPVSLRGTTADVNAVTAADVRVTADLNEVSSASGTYTVAAEVQVDTGGNVGVVGSYQITVTISDLEPEEDVPPAEEDTT